MAKFLNIEIDTAQLRVAEVDSRGQRIFRCFVIPVPLGAVDDGQIRDTKSLGNLLKTELAAHGIKTKPRTVPQINRLITQLKYEVHTILFL